MLAGRSFSQGIFVVSVATLIYVYLIFPSLIIVPISFGNRVELIFPPAEFTLDLYRDYLGSATWLEVTYRSFRTALFASVLALLLGVPCAYALSRIDFVGKQLLVTFLLSPILAPIVVISLGLYIYYSRIGLSGTVAGIVIAHAMYVMPFVILTISAGISQLDERLETAATIMGATRPRIFWEIVLPRLRPSLTSAGLFAFLMSFDEVVIAWFITGPTTMTLPVKMYSSIKWETSPVLAAVATILTVVSIVVCLLVFLFTRGRSVSNKLP